LTAKHSLRNIVGWLSVYFSSYLFTGCATYLNKNRMVVGIESIPTKAKVYLAGTKEHLCVTPCEYKITKGGIQKLEIRWQGAPAQFVDVKRSMHPGFWWNFFFGPGVVIGMPIDMLTSSVFRPNYKGIFVQFDPTLTIEEEEEEVEEVDDTYVRLPDTPELRRVKEQFPEDEVRKQIDLYYGPQADDETYFRLIDRLYLIMINMYRASERLDIDEAIRRDHFLNPKTADEDE
jgi:hypothetical protein